MIDLETFEYIVKNEAGEVLGSYNSTDEPPMKGDIIYLSNFPTWDPVEVLGMSMELTKRHNTVVLKVRLV
jgi:hypothetical protein